MSGVTVFDDLLSDNELAWRISDGIQTAKTDPLTFEMMLELAAFMLRQRRGVTLELADWIAGVLTDKNQATTGQGPQTRIAQPVHRPRDLAGRHGLRTHADTQHRNQGRQTKGRKAQAISL